MILILYVDDGLIASKSEELMMEFLNDMNKYFPITTQEPSVFVGLEIKRYVNEGTIVVSQSNYIERILVKYGMEDCSACKSPADPNTKLLPAERVDEKVKEDFQMLIGSLRYVVWTRLDIAFPVTQLSKFIEKPSMMHYQSAKRILRYLKGTKHYALRYGATNVFGKLIAFSDADHASDVISRKSIGAYVLMLNGGPISWKSKQQSIVATSSTESEFNALFETVREIMWIRQLLKDLDLIQDESTTLYCDNQAAISITTKESFCRNTKHWDIRLHFVREKQEEGVVQVKYICTKDQPADILTKNLPSTTIERHLHSMGIVTDQH